MHQRSLYYFWPGLPHLWLSGNLTGLAVAISFSLLGNALLLMTFVWPSDSPQWMIWLGWPTFVTGWVVGVRRQLRHPVSSLVSPPADSALSDQLLLEAQRAYLGREWSNALRIVDELINENSRDLESRLLKVAIQRRTGDLQGAQAELSTVFSLDVERSWHFEIEAERRWLTELESEDSAESSEDDQIEPELPDSDSTSNNPGEEIEAPHEITSYDSTYSRLEEVHRESESLETANSTLVEHRVDATPGDSAANGSSDREVASREVTRREAYWPDGLPRDETANEDEIANDDQLTTAVEVDAEVATEHHPSTDGLPNSEPQTNNSKGNSADGEPRHSSRHAA